MRNNIKKLQIGDILTSLTILTSVIAMLISYSQDRNLRIKEKADNYRQASALTIANVERWKILSLSLFQKAQPIFVETSNKIVKKNNNSINIDKINKNEIIIARDFLWENLNKIKTFTDQKIIDEKIEIAYVHLYSYHPAIRNVIINTIELLTKKEDLMFNQLLADTEKNIVSFLNYDRNKYQTPLLGNKLRTTASAIQITYKKDLETVCLPLFNVLYEMIIASDKKLLNKTTLSQKFELLRHSMSSIEVSCGHYEQSPYQKKILSRFGLNPQLFEEKKQNENHDEKIHIRGSKFD